MPRAPGVRPVITTKPGDVLADRYRLVDLLNEIQISVVFEHDLRGGLRIADRVGHQVPAQYFAIGILILALPKVSLATVACAKR